MPGEPKAEAQTKLASLHPVGATRLAKKMTAAPPREPKAAMQMTVMRVLRLLALLHPPHQDYRLSSKVAEAAELSTY